MQSQVRRFGRGFCDIYFFVMRYSLIYVWQTLIGSLVHAGNLVLVRGQDSSLGRLFFACSPSLYIIDVYNNEMLNHRNNIIRMPPDNLAFFSNLAPVKTSKPQVAFQSVKEASLVN